MNNSFQEKVIAHFSSIFEVLQFIDCKVKENGEILQTILKEKSPVTHPDDIQNAIAAKIIKEVCEKIDKCECIEKYFGKLKDKNSTFKEGILDPKKEPSGEEEPSDKEESAKPSGLHKYSYPNYGVGNASLGSSGNPNALTWPFDKK